MCGQERVKRQSEALLPEKKKKRVEEMASERRRTLQKCFREAFTNSAVCLGAKVSRTNLCGFFGVYLVGVENLRSRGEKSRMFTILSELRPRS